MIQGHALVLRNELDRAAAAAVDAIRERVRAIPADRRHVLVVDGQEIEVVETSAGPYPIL